MQLTAKHRSLHWRNDKIKKLTKIMKLTALLLFVVCLQLSAKTWGQNVTLKVKNVPLKEVCKEIQKQTGYNIMADEAVLLKAGKVSLNVHNMPVAAALQQCLKNKPITYSISEGSIVLKAATIATVQSTAIMKQNPPPPIELKGLVTDSKGTPLNSVTVLVKGSNVGTITNENGQFILNNINTTDQIEVSIVGYFSQTVKVGANTFLKIVLIEEKKEMEEAIVVGYGNVKKKDITGSVVRIGQKSIEQSSFTTIGQVLQGQVSGMEVVSGNGRPGDQVRIRIRGESSLQGDASPLIVIDDVPMPDGYDINLINPNDITNIDILKGASAAAIFGSKGSGGVILITTKRGGSNAPEITLNSNVSTKGFVSRIEGLNAEDYKALAGRQVPYNYEILRQQFPDRYHDLRTASEFRMIAVPGYFGNADTKWTDVLTQRPLNLNQIVGIRGGSTEASYYASFGFTKDMGRIIENESSRKTLLLNMDLRPKKFFEMGFRISGSDNPIVSALGGDLNSVFNRRPDVPVYDNLGNYYRHFSTGQNVLLDNPLQVAKNAPELSNNFQYTISGYGKIIFNKNLRYQITYAYTDQKGEASTFEGSYTASGSANGITGVRRNSSNYSRQVNMDNTLTYTLSKSKHDLIALVGTTFNKDNVGTFNQVYQNFPDDLIQNATYNATQWISSNGSDDGSAAVSAFSRLNYRYNDRYLFTGTIRRDVSSRFSPAYRSGWFPSAALGWVMSEEKFLKNNNINLSFMKLRLGYGVTGDSRIGRYSWRTLFGNGSYFNQPAVRPIATGNENVRWEQSNQLDLGIDFGFWKNRITGTLGYYNKKTNGLLYAYSLVPSAGLTNVNLNLAKINNVGIEFDFKAQLIEQKDWSFSVGANIASNRGKVLNLDKSVVADAFGTVLGANTTSVLQEGKPIGLIYGYNALGIVQSYEQGQKLLTTPGVAFFSGSGAGETYYEDLDGDGRLSLLYDRKVIGKSVPDFFGGFNMDLRYKKFTARVTGKYSYGASKHWTALRDNFHTNLFNPDNSLTYALLGWTPDLPNSPFQRFGSSFEPFADNYLYDGSYLKFTDAYLTYDLTSRWVEKIGLRTLSVYGAVNNIVTLTRYPGSNVESFSNNPVSGTALDFSIYPLERTYTLGVKLLLR
jgi:TonB-dependent starch-binding outer membrane protein SusC